MSENISLQIKKIIKAKRQKVFEAWTQPDLMNQWYTPGNRTIRASCDLRIGGAYQVEMKGEKDGQNVTHTTGGVYRKIIPNELLSFTWGWAGDSEPETLVTVTLRDVEGGTELTLVHERFADTESRDGHQQGWAACLENLDKFCGHLEGNTANSA